MRVPYSCLEELIPELANSLIAWMLDANGSDSDQELQPTLIVNPSQSLIDLLDNLGMPVEAVHVLPSAPRGVVIVEVEEVNALPDAEHVVQAIVSDGTQRYSVVTGAPNCRVGLRSALAKAGTHLSAIEMTVQATEMRGVASEGMLCSPKELGLYDYAAGLIEFTDDVTPGDKLSELWLSETVLEVELTPNRADAFSILGIARDVAAKLGLSYRHPAAALPLPPQVSEHSAAADKPLHIRVDDPQGCPRFTLRCVEGVSIKPSPIWLQRRLAALGLRPRNNVVDVTNYVTFELGQPSHAYDYRDLQQGSIIVRTATAGERLQTLNEDEVEFSDEDLLITTPQAEQAAEPSLPIGVAGIIGGLHHSVKADTETIALEVAYFDPVRIRKSAKRLKLSTDAHYRFERGVDPNLAPLASARACQLISEIAGGRAQPYLCTFGSDVSPAAIDYQPSRLEFLMAMHVPEDKQRGYLEALGCKVRQLDNDRWRVTPPSWRVDMHIAEDLIEEVSRMHGYEHIPESLPAMHFIPSNHDATQRRLRETLAAMGFQEVINYVFSSDEQLQQAGAPAAHVQLVSPQSAERSVLRTALYPGLLATARLNAREESLALFEIGHSFTESEEEKLALLLRGPWVPGHWLPPQAADFYVFKGMLEKLAGYMGAQLQLEPSQHPALHPGVSAKVLWQGRNLGFMGRVHPEIAKRFALPECYIAELALPLEPAPISFRDIRKQPYAERDIAIVAPLNLSYSALRYLVSEAAGQWLESCTPFDIYAEAPIPEGQRSVALRLRFRHPERALRDDEVDSDMANIMTAVSRAGYDVRDG